MPEQFEFYFNFVRHEAVKYQTVHLLAIGENMHHL